MSIDATPDPPPGDVVLSETALACLFRLGAQNGVYAEIGAVRRRNLIDGDTVPVARLVELAGAFGLHAERARFDWDSLHNTPFSHPILLLLANKNVVALMGMRRDGSEEVAVSDPLLAYIHTIVTSSRKISDLRLPVSTRGAQAFYRATQAWALLSGREYATPDDVQAVAESVLSHRILSVASDGFGAGGREREIVKKILAQVAVPV